MADKKSVLFSFESYLGSMLHSHCPVETHWHCRNSLTGVPEDGLKLGPLNLLDNFAYLFIHNTNRGYYPYKKTRQICEIMATHSTLLTKNETSRELALQLYRYKLSVTVDSSVPHMK
jgi:hypothetical protein